MTQAVTSLAGQGDNTKLIQEAMEQAGRVEIDQEICQGFFPQSDTEVFDLMLSAAEAHYVPAILRLVSKPPPLSQPNTIDRLSHLRQISADLLRAAVDKGSPEAYVLSAAVQEKVAVQAGQSAIDAQIEALALWLALRSRAAPAYVGLVDARITALLGARPLGDSLVDAAKRRSEILSRQLRVDGVVDFSGQAFLREDDVRCPHE